MCSTELLSGATPSEAQVTHLCICYVAGQQRHWAGGPADRVESKDRLSEKCKPTNGIEHFYKERIIELIG